MNLSFRRVALYLLSTFLVFTVIIFSFSYYTVRQFAYCRPETPQELAISSKRFNELIAHGAQKIELKTHDNLTLTALFIERPHAQRAIILCHGYRMSKERMARIAAMFPDDTLLLFDFRGHGCSQGQIISLGCHEVTDINAAVQFLKNNSSTQHLPLVGIGVSMGGASLLAATAHGAPFNALITDSSFARLYDQICHRFVKSTGLPTMPFMQPTIWLFEYTVGCSINSISPAQAITRINCPVMIIHSLDDDFTPVKQAEILYAAAHEPKELWLVPKARHGYIAKDYPQEYAQRTHEFLKKYLP